MRFVGYDVCHFMAFVGYDVCHLMMFVALWCLSPYYICWLWQLLPNDVCHLLYVAYDVCRSAYCTMNNVHAKIDKDTCQGRKRCLHYTVL